MKTRLSNPDTTTRLQATMQQRLPELDESIVSPSHEVLYESQIREFIMNLPRPCDVLMAIWKKYPLLNTWLLGKKVPYCNIARGFSIESRSISHEALINVAYQAIHYYKNKIRNTICFDNPLIKIELQKPNETTMKILESALTRVYEGHVTSFAIKLLSLVENNQVLVMLDDRYKTKKSNNDRIRRNVIKSRLNELRKQQHSRKQKVNKLQSKHVDKFLELIQRDPFPKLNIYYLWKKYTSLLDWCRGIPVDGVVPAICPLPQLITILQRLNDDNALKLINDICDDNVQLQVLPHEYPLEFKSLMISILNKGIYVSQIAVKFLASITDVNFLFELHDTYRAQSCIRDPSFWDRRINVIEKQLFTLGFDGQLNSCNGTKRVHREGSPRDTESTIELDPKRQCVSQDSETGDYPEYSLDEVPVEAVDVVTRSPSLTLFNHNFPSLSSSDWHDDSDNEVVSVTETPQSPRPLFFSIFHPVEESSAINDGLSLFPDIEMYFGTELDDGFPYVPQLKDSL